MKRKAAILARFGITISKSAHILDFGCGAGCTVYSFVDHGCINTGGYDIKDYLSLRDPENRSRFLCLSCCWRVRFKRHGALSFSTG